MMILGAAEQQVSLLVVLDLSDRSLVTMHHDWLHDDNSTELNSFLKENYY